MKKKISVYAVVALPAESKDKLSLESPEIEAFKAEIEGKLESRLRTHTLPVFECDRDLNVKTKFVWGEVSWPRVKRVETWGVESGFLGQAIIGEVEYFLDFKSAEWLASEPLRRLVSALGLCEDLKVTAHVPAFHGYSYREGELRERVCRQAEAELERALEVEAIGEICKVLPGVTPNVYVRVAESPSEGVWLGAVNVEVKSAKLDEDVCEGLAEQLRGRLEHTLNLERLRWREHPAVFTLLAIDGARYDDR